MTTNTKRYLPGRNPHFTPLQPGDPSQIGNDLANTIIGDPYLRATADQQRGYGGNDYMNGGELNDTQFGGLGWDSIFGGNGDDIIYGDSSDPLFIKTNAMGGNDWIEAGNGRDKAFGEGGDDTLLGGGDNDFLDGGQGNDLIEGGKGNDELYGQKGKDTIHGNEGDDKISGNANEDLLYGSGGRDLIFGGEADDQLFGGGNADSLAGGRGHDLIFGGEGNDILGEFSYVERAADNTFRTITGIEPGNDTLVGGDGNDTIRGGNGQNKMEGRRGNDYLVSWGEGSTYIGTEHGLINEKDVFVVDKPDVPRTTGSLFVLGDQLGVFYTNDGNSGYARIKGFEKGRDVIQLNRGGTYQGSQNKYQFVIPVTPQDPGPYKLGSTYIYITELYGRKIEPDLIGIVERVGARIDEATDISYV